MDKDIKKRLVYAYHVLSYLGLDDHTYTHLSSRSSANDAFFMYPFGLCFEEITEESLMKISFEGKILEGKESYCNKTGYMIHGSIYKKRSDIHSIFHLHTPEIVAVSACERGLLPISQWALHFYDHLSYHAYDSLALEAEQGERMSDDLGKNYTMLLAHHGSITCGKTIEEAMFYTYHLQKACKTQCLALSMNTPLKTLSHEVCVKTVEDLLSFEKNLGERDWKAWVRKVTSQSGEIKLDM